MGGDKSSTVRPVSVRLRNVGLTADAWTQARVRAAQGGPSAQHQLTVALTRYLTDGAFRSRVDAVEPGSPRLARNVRIDDALWAEFSQQAPRRRVYATADAALRLSMDDDADG